MKVGQRRQPLVEAALERLIELRQIERSLDRVQIDGHRRQRLLLQRGRRIDIVVEAVDRDDAPVILHRGEQLHERPDRVRHDAAPVAGVQIAVRAARPQLETEHAAHAEAQARVAVLIHRAIAGDDEVRRQFVAVLAGEDGHLRAADLLLAFEQHLDIAGQRAAYGEERFERQNLREVLPLVVAHAARVEPPVADRRLEGGREPLVQRVGRLDIVMAVEDHRRRARRVVPLGEHHRPPGGRDDPRRQPDALHHVRDVRRHLGDAQPVRADARPPHIVDQAVEEFLPVRVHIREHIAQIRRNGRRHGTSKVPMRNE